MPMRNIKRQGWRKWLPRRGDQLGRRGATLLLMGTLWLLVGVSVTHGLDAPYDEPPPGVFHLLIPETVRGLIWTVTGMLAVVYAFRPPGFSDAFAWTALYLMPTMRTVSFGVGWLDSMIPWGTEGYSRGWVPMVTWGIVVALIVVCAGWREPIDVSLASRLAHDDNTEED